MTPDDSRHGTYSGSQAHIRNRTAMCDPCHTAHLRYRRRRRYDNALGRPRMVSALPIIQHLESLRGQGVTVTDIASRAGVSYSMIDELLNRPRDVIRSDNADALLATSPPPSPRGQVAALGTIRRIRALGCLGWAMRDIEATANVKMETLRRINSLEPPHVKVATADAVADAYVALCMNLPPKGRRASQVRTRAMAKGWAPPLAWDDIETDVAPQVGRDRFGRGRDEYDAAIVERILGGDWRVKANRAERLDVAARWRGSLSELEALTGWQTDRDRKAAS